MKKQFLLSLMAMLLPLAAWAQEVTIAGSSISFARPTVEYNGDETKAPAITVTSSDGQTVSPADYKVEYYSDAEGSNSVELHDAGTYYVKIVNSSNESDSEMSSTSFEVGKATLTVTVGNVEKEYGESDATLTPKYSVTGFKSGDDQYSVNLDLKLSRMSGQDGEAIGSYSITLINNTELTNYSIVVTGQASVNITPATLKVTIQGETKVYGDEDPDFKTTNIEGFKFNDAGSVNVTVKREDKGEDVAEYPLTAEVDSKNYKVELENEEEAKLEITPATLTVTIENATITYGDPVEKYVVEAKGYKFEDNAETVGLKVATEDGEALTAGTHKVKATITSQNYTLESTEATLTVNKATLTVTANDAEKTYGDEDPTFTVKYEGFKNSDDETLFSETTPAATRDDATNQNAGTYTITPATLTADNYDFEYKTGTFTINRAELTITVQPQTINFGEEPNLEVTENKTITIAGLVNNETFSNNTVTLAEKLSYNTEDGEAITAVGSHEKALTIVASSNNYEITVVEGQLTINGDPDGITLDGAAEEVESLLAGYDGQTVNVTIKNLRNFNGGNDYMGNYKIEKEHWYTLVLPFDIRVSELSQKFGYAIVNIPNTANNDPNKVQFKLWMQEIPANTLIAFKVDEDVNWEGKEIRFESKTIVAPTNEYSVENGNMDGAGSKFIGIYKKTTITGSKDYFLDYYDGTIRTASAVYDFNKHGLDVCPLNGYVEGKSAEARIYMEEADGTITAINAVTSETSNNTEGWYTIGGVKLNGEPTEKGIYINNGKKVVIK